MATLSESLENFLSTLSEEEQTKYWKNYEEDFETKAACLLAGQEWNSEEESAAIRYLRNLKKRKELLVEKDKVGLSEVGAKRKRKLRTDRFEFHFSEEEELDYEDIDYLSSSEFASPQNESKDLNSNQNLDISSSDNDSGSRKDDNNESESEYGNCRSVKAELHGYIKKENETATSSLDVRTIVYPPIKKFPIEYFRKIYDDANENGFGVFHHVCTGYIRGQLVKIKSFSQKVCTSRSNSDITMGMIFQLQHRNLIPMLGMMDVGMAECPQLVYSTEEKDISLLQYLLTKDNNFPKDYATLGKFSLDIINACEYLHSRGIVHGYLSATSVTVQRVCRHYGKNDEKIHFNCLLGDYGIILLTDGVVRGDFYKARNGKLVHLRWSPKELLLDEGKGTSLDNSHSFMSDVWSFGIVMWELWTYGEVPYGLKRSNTDVERAILGNTSPLTFKTPETCPRHILNVMKSIFTPEAGERPAFFQLKEKFDEFRKHKYAQKDTEKRAGSTKAYKPKRTSPSVYTRLKEPVSAPSSNFRSPVFKRLGHIARKEPHEASKFLTQRVKHRSQNIFSKPRGFQTRKPQVNGNNNNLALLCVPILPSPGTSFMSQSRGIDLSQILTAAAGLPGFVPDRSNVGTNSVNVNIQSSGFHDKRGQDQQQRNRRRYH